jgi:FixJ family two-component response regulator
MTERLVLVVRETASLADSVQLLLETVGFRVVPISGVPDALRHLSDPGEERPGAVVVACNQPTSETLRSFPESFPPSAREIPILVVGDRAAESRRAWPSNIRFVPLPFEGRGILELVDLMTSHSPPSGPVENGSPATG